MYALFIPLATRSEFFFYYTDTDHVSLGGNLVIQKQSIGVASSATGFQGVDGILGCVISIANYYTAILKKLSNIA
jgi:hypothetical protein